MPGSKTPLPSSNPSGHIRAFSYHSFFGLRECSFSCMASTDTRNTVGWIWSLCGLFPYYVIRYLMQWLFLEATSDALSSRLRPKSQDFHIKITVSSITDKLYVWLIINWRSDLQFAHPLEKLQRFGVEFVGAIVVFFELLCAHLDILDGRYWYLSHIELVQVILMLAKNFRRLWTIRILAGVLLL